MRKRQLGSSMLRCEPKYQLSVTFSVLTTSAYWLGKICSILAARSAAMMPAEQPMPARL